MGAVHCNVSGWLVPPALELVISANASASPARLHLDVADFGVRGQQPAQYRLGLARDDLAAVGISADFLHLGPGPQGLQRQGGAAQDVLARHVGAHFIDGAAGHQPAVCDHRHAIGQRLGLFDVVRGQDDGAAFVDQVAQHLPQGLARLHVEAHGGLIEEQQLGPADNRHGELRLALLAAGQLAVGTVGNLLDAEPFDHGLHVVRDSGSSWRPAR